MRTFSKLLLAAGAIFAVASCQTAEESFAPAGKLKVTASFENASTRVDYNIDNTSNTITPSWTVGDEIFGWDNTGVTFTFTCTEVVDNEAIFSYDPYEPAEGTTTLYAIYYPGKTATNIETGQLAVDLTAQEGSLDKDAPVLMSATATVSGENIHFSFHNDAVIVGLKKFKVGASDQVNSVTIKGLSATGTYEVKDGKLVLTPATMASDITATVDLTANTDGIVETPVYFAALPTAETSLTVSATTAGTNYSSETSTKAFQAGKYYYMTKILEEEAEEFVIEVPSVEYDSIDAAFTDAQGSESPCTIKLMAKETLTVNPTIADGKVTLDLNGNILVTNNQYITVTGGSLDIVDSKWSYTSSEEGGKLSSKRSNLSTFVINGGEVNFISGFIENTGTSTETSIFRFNSSAAAATLNIKGGHLSAYRVIDFRSGSNATANVSGGYLESNSNSQNAIVISAAGTLNVSGGTIKAKEKGTSNPAAIYCSNSGARVYIFEGTDKNGNPTIPCLFGSNKSDNGRVLSASNATNGQAFQTVNPDGKPVKFYSNVTGYNNIPGAFPDPSTCTSHTDAYGNTFGYGVNL